MVQKVGTLVVGAGVIGSSVAMHLAKMGVPDIRVIDFDLEGSLSSSELNAGGVRATWLQPLNIELSKITIEYLASIAEEVGYKASGYLWLHTPNRWETALKARELQMRSGWPVEAWDVPELKRRYPFIDKVEGIAGAIFAPRDGLVNPNLLKNHFRAAGKALGVIYDDRTLLRGVQYSDQNSSMIQLSTERFESVLSHEMKLEVASVLSTDFKRSRVDYQAERVINCAGPWASRVAEILGYSSPSRPVRRQVSIFDCKEVDLTPYGMVVDTSGVYFHPEATNGLAGFASHHEPSGYNYSYEGENFFTDQIWPALYERSTCFERLKHLTGWAGLYEVSPDECAIMGPVVYGEPGRNGNVFEAHSFSGHGIMQSYSAGRLLAERVVKGRYESLDVSPLSANRFETGQLVQEKWVI